MYADLKVSSSHSSVQYAACSLTRNAAASDAIIMPFDIQHSSDRFAIFISASQYGNRYKDSRFEFLSERPRDNLESR